MNFKRKTLKDLMKEILEDPASGRIYNKISKEKTKRKVEQYKEILSNLKKIHIKIK